MNAVDLRTGPCGSAVAVLQPCPRSDASPTCSCGVPLAPAAVSGEVLIRLGWSCSQHAEGTVFERTVPPKAAVTVHQSPAGAELWLDADEVLSVELAEELATALLEAAALARTAQR